MVTKFKPRQNFKANTVDENTQIIANLLPLGEIFDAKNIEDSNLRKLLKSTSYETTRLQSKIEEIDFEYFFERMTNLLPQMERALAIPNDCFKTNVPIEQRRKQVIAKFAKMNITTKDEWIDLAAYFGYDIEILYAVDNGYFPYTFDYYFFDEENETQFTIFIKFKGLYKPENVFPCTFDYKFEDTDLFIICMFNKIKPANVRIIYLYEDS